jgi:cellulose synthase/poly-beta-1,6-N-acetylglucosamine synthase-like glycosyltransferase
MEDPHEYQFFLSKYNLDENRQIKKGISTFNNLLNPQQLMTNFRDPRKLTSMFILFFVLPWLYYHMAGNEHKENFFLIMIPVAFGFFFFFIVIKMMGDNIYKEVSKGYALIQNKTS